MRRLPAFSIALTCLSQAAAAAITSHAALFTTVCIDDKVIGLDWQNGGWHEGMFFPNKYTLQKRDPNTPECAAAISAAPAFDDLFGDVAYGCYTIADFGNGPGSPLACAETWERGDDGSEALTNVNCAAIGSFEWIVFNPIGPFQYARLGGDLAANPKDGIKDPLTMSVGNCNLGRPPGLYPPGPG